MTLAESIDTVSKLEAQRAAVLACVRRFRKQLDPLVCRQALGLHADPAAVTVLQRSLARADNALRLIDGRRVLGYLALHERAAADQDDMQIELRRRLATARARVTLADRSLTQLDGREVLRQALSAAIPFAPSTALEKTIK